MTTTAPADQTWVMVSTLLGVLKVLFLDHWYVWLFLLAAAFVSRVVFAKSR